MVGVGCSPVRSLIRHVQRGPAERQPITSILTRGMKTRKSQDTIALFSVATNSDRIRFPLFREELTASPRTRTGHNTRNHVVVACPVVCDKNPKGCYRFGSSIGMWWSRPDPLPIYRNEPTFDSDCAHIRKL